MKWIAIFAISLFLSTSLYANDQKETKKPVQLIAGIGLTSGGDDLVKVFYTDGETDKLKAGNLLDLKAGALINLNEEISVQSTLGYHFDTLLEAENGDGSFSRIPLDLLGFYNIKKHRIGTGLTIHTNTELDLDTGIPGIDGKFEMKESVGLVLEYGYQFSPNTLFGIRYVDIDYEIDKVNGVPVIATAKIDGSHFGGYFYVTF